MRLADILKARIQTLGVEEHPLRVETGTTGSYDTASRALNTHIADENRWHFSMGGRATVEHYRCRR